MFSRLHQLNGKQAPGPAFSAFFDLESTMRKLLISLTLAAGLAASASAGAATYDLGVLTESVTLFGPYTMNLGPNPTFASFDMIDFSITKEENITFTGAPINNPPNMDINSFGMSLWGPGNVALGGTGVGGTALWVPPGNYQILIGAVLDGTSGGQYSGSIQLSPVPEAGTGVMMLAGLGMLAFVAKRRTM
ncbi:MAG TPA: FxDxF family PEP-CTERM protein [Burkholderiaceae bacterium]